jgi:hypothetical protein
MKDTTSCYIHKFERFSTSSNFLTELGARETTSMLELWILGLGLGWKEVKNKTRGDLPELDVQTAWRGRGRCLRRANIDVEESWCSRKEFSRG